jgi:hypothetical protein
MSNFFALGCFLGSSFPENGKLAPRQKKPGQKDKKPKTPKI